MNPQASFVGGGTTAGVSPSTSVRRRSFRRSLSDWRMARDVRAYVAEINGLVEGAELKITEGGNADQDLKWALAYADQIDPLTCWRKDIAKVKAEAAGKPCPDCGKVHSSDERHDAVAAAMLRQRWSTRPGLATRDSCVLDQLPLP
jgi:hypothetical protein